MRRVRTHVTGAIAGLAFMVLLGACAAAPMPTPLPTRTRLPTLPPPTPLIITLQGPAVTLEPSWTPPPTRTTAATRTPLPTVTPTIRPAVTNTPALVAVTPGVLNGDTLTLAISAAELERELAVDRISPIISTVVSSDPTVTLTGTVIRLDAVFNNFTTEGLRAEVEFILRYSGSEVRVNVAGYRSARGTVLTQSQLTAIRDLLRQTINRLLFNQLQGVTSAVARAQITNIFIQENQLFFAYRLTFISTSTPEIMVTEDSESSG